MENKGLTDEQLEDLHRDLAALKREIARFLGLTGEGARPVELDEPIGRLTRMDALQQQSLARANKESLEVKRRQVEAALEAIERGEYGLCRRCDEPTGYRRLKVRPETPFCVRCQESLESKT